MPREIKTLAEQILHRPITVQINSSLPAPTISHALFHVSKEERAKLLERLFNENNMEGTLVFTRIKHKAKSLALHGIADTVHKNLVGDKLRTIRLAWEMINKVRAGITTVRNIGP